MRLKTTFNRNKFLWKDILRQKIGFNQFLGGGIWVQAPKGLTCGKSNRQGKKKSSCNQINKKILHVGAVEGSDHFKFLFCPLLQQWGLAITNFEGLNKTEITYWVKFNPLFLFYCLLVIWCLPVGGTKSNADFLSALLSCGNFLAENGDGTAVFTTK